MSAPDAAPLKLHDDAALFGEAVNFTAAETGFPARLIEKDYFCTVLLQCLAPDGGPLVFKGGTCLAKVHAGFYRLSEDDPELVALVRWKLAVAGNEPVDASPTRLAALRPQLETELRPVLRARDFAEFDLDRAFDTVARLAASLGAR